jgi:hypothetical protein
MTLTIGDDSMSSDRTPHAARRAPADTHSWEVSWLPGRHIDRNSAITAMVLADMVASEDMSAGHRLWPHIEGWASELALTAPGALSQIAHSPSWADADRSGTLNDSEAAE